MIYGYSLLPVSLFIRDLLAFSMSDAHHDTGKVQKGDIFMTQQNALQYGLQFIRYAGAKFWNNIPSNIKQAPSAMSFRRQLKFQLPSTKCKL